jgi:hypothetical protein
MKEKNRDICQKPTKRQKIVLFYFFFVLKKYASCFQYNMYIKEEKIAYIDIAF